MTSRTSCKIIVGVDGSESSVASLKWAASLALRQHATVSAVMAWNYPTALLVPVVGAPVLPGDFAAQTTRDTLTEVTSRIDTLGVPVEQSVVMGAPRLVLTEGSEDHDVLVFGRTQSGRLKQIFLGSTASYCVRHASCPVVVVRDATVVEHGITVAVDGSPSSIQALVWAIELGDEHEILAVYSHDEWELDDLPLDDRFREDLDQKAEQVLADAVSAATDQCGGGEGRIKRQVRQGDPRTTVVDEADPDRLLVLGAQGHSGLARWMLGSLADYAVQHAPGTVAIWR